MESTDDKNILIHEDDFITPAQKLIFLKYMQLNANFITQPRNFPKLINLISNEHNKVCGETDLETILCTMQNWITSVKMRFNEMVSARKTYAFPTEDVELLNFINSDKKPNINELSCILDHLEIAYSSPKVWVTIALEMEAMGSKKGEEYWRRAFERWCSKVKRKKQILDQMDISESEKHSFLSTLEFRVLEILDKIEAEESKTAGYFCRICIQNKDQELKNIYDTITDSMTLAEKISQCANVPEAHKEDNLPQYICKPCHDLLENAYKFKNLCEYSDEQLRLAARNKSNYVEYVLEEVEIYQPVSGEEEENPDEEISIEMNLSFDNDVNAADNEMDKRERNTECEESETVDKIAKGAEDIDIHQCSLCSTICYNKSTLKKHMHVHSVSRPHSCSVCHKDFKTKLSLRIHMRSHTGERPYVCEVCGKAFTQDATLSYHRSIHTGAKPYLCNLCDYRARNVNDLKIHMRKHTGARPYQCDLCPSKFTTSSNLQKHVRRHTGVKNFQCSTCTRTFFSRESARKHMVIHTGLKPYNCTECSMAYGWYNGLQKHMKAQHPGVKMPTEKYFLDQLENKK